MVKKIHSHPLRQPCHRRPINKGQRNSPSIMKLSATSSYSEQNTSVIIPPLSPCLVIQSLGPHAEAVPMQVPRFLATTFEI